MGDGNLADVIIQRRREREQAKLLVSLVNKRKITVEAAVETAKEFEIEELFMELYELEQKGAADAITTEHPNDAV